MGHRQLGGCGESAVPFYAAELGRAHPGDATVYSGLKHQQENVLPNGVTIVGSERDDNPLRWGSDTNSVMV